MANIKILRNQLIDVLNNVKSLSHDLTADELDELIDEVKCLYERFSDMTEARTGVKQ
jgi:hypothetical protein